MNDIILEIQDMQYLDWNLRKMPSGTPGCFASIILLQTGIDMEPYDEYKLLLKNQGRSCQDELYIESF